MCKNKLTFLCFGILLRFDFPFMSMLSPSKTTLHGDGGSKVQSSQSASVEDSSIPLSNRIMPPSPGWNRRKQEIYNVSFNDVLRICVCFFYLCAFLARWVTIFLPNMFLKPQYPRQRHLIHLIFHGLLTNF